MTFLMDKDARPSPKDMKLWVDVVRFVKRGARGGALGFFTYMELSAYLRLVHLPLCAVAVMYMRTDERGGVDTQRSGCCCSMSSGWTG